MVDCLDFCGTLKAFDVRKCQSERVLLKTVGNLGQASAEDIAGAADLDIGRVETSLRRLVRAGQIRKTTEQKYGITAARHSKSQK